MSELEEREREETFRLKRFKELKYVHKAQDVKEAVVRKMSLVPDLILPIIFDESLKGQSIDEMQLRLKTMPKTTVPEKLKKLEEVEERDEDEKEAQKKRRVSEPIIHKKISKTITDKAIPDKIKTGRSLSTVSFGTQVSTTKLDKNLEKSRSSLWQADTQANQGTENRILHRVQSPKADTERTDSYHYKERIENLQTTVNQLIEMAGQLEGSQKNMHAFKEKCEAVKHKIKELCCSCEENHLNLPPYTTDNIPPPVTPESQSLSLASKKLSESNSADISLKTDSAKTVSGAPCPPVCGKYSGMPLVYDPLLSSAGVCQVTSTDKPTIPTKHMEPLSVASELQPVTKDGLGYFENEYKEISRISRFMNPDGTISEEKQVIRIKTERQNVLPSEFKDRGWKDNRCVKDCFSGTSECGYSGAQENNVSSKNSSTYYNSQAGPSTVTKYDSVPGTCNDCGRNLSSGHVETLPWQNVSMPETPNTCPYMPCSNQNDASSSISRLTDECSCFKNTKTWSKQTDSVLVGSNMLVPCESKTVCDSETEVVPKCVSLSTSVQSCWTENSAKNTTLDKTTNCMECSKICYNPPNNRNDANSWGNSEEIASPIEQRNHNCKCSKRNCFDTFKVLSKPACNATARSKGSEIILKGSILNALRRLLLPSNRAIESSPSPATSSESRSHCSCLGCQSKFSMQSKKFGPKTVLNSLLFTYATQIAFDDGKKVSPKSISKESCISCGTLGTLSVKSGNRPIPSAAGSTKQNSQSSRKSSRQSIFSECKAACSLLARTIKGKCSPPKETEVCCPKRRSSLATQISVPKKVAKSKLKNASTSTKVSDRYDCRTLRSLKTVHPCAKIRRRACTCHSDTHMLIQYEPCCSVSRTRSYCGAHYHCFH